MTRRTSRPTPSGTVIELAIRKRIVVVVGAGGVGKTTLSAAIAVAAARRGRRVACLTIDPARRLADSLGVTAHLPEERVRDITDVLGPEVAPMGRLHFGMLDPKSTFDEMIRERASSKAVAGRILSNRIYKYVSSSLSGVQEYMALEALCKAEQRTDLDLVVLDTPPTANALDFFTAPRRMSEALDGKLVRIMRRAAGGAGRVGFDLLGRSAAAILRTLARFTGGELLDEMLGFVDALSDLFGSLSDQAKEVEKVLRGRDVAFCLVTTPDKATLREAKGLRDHLGELGLRVDAVIFNRAHWPTIPLPERELPQGAALELEALRERWNRAHEAERAQIERVERAWEGIELVAKIPVLPVDLSRIDTLDQIARFL